MVAEEVEALLRANGGIVQGGYVMHGLQPHVAKILRDKHKRPLVWLTQNFPKRFVLNDDHLQLRDGAQPQRSGRPTHFRLSSALHVARALAHDSVLSGIPRRGSVACVALSSGAGGVFSVATPTATYTVDAPYLDSALGGMLASSQVTKIAHDFAAADFDALRALSVRMASMLDTQLAAELLLAPKHPMHSTLADVLSWVGVSGRQDPAPALLQCSGTLLAKLAPHQLRDLVAASGVRLARGARLACFDTSKSHRLASAELLDACRPEHALRPRRVVEVGAATSLESLLNILPEALASALDAQDDLGRLRDVTLDVGRPPSAWIDGERVTFANVGAATVEHVHAACAAVPDFGGDNRTGVDGSLHRISAIRNRDFAVTGLTCRFGRHLTGTADLLTDILLGTSQSVLLVGAPGCGKTTVVREIASTLAEAKNVFVVDTSNEIAGHGDTPHACIGRARRAMVVSLDKQASVMVEVVQNHTPDVLVIDEIGRPQEVKAALTCRQRGVRLIASAHGSLREIVSNPDLRGLIGGVQSVTLGDELARQTSKRGSIPNKTVSQRLAAPTFDVIVELQPDTCREQFRLVLDVATAVDEILEGNKYTAQLRSRDPVLGGDIHVVDSNF